MIRHELQQPSLYLLKRFCCRLRLRRIHPELLAGLMISLFRLDGFLAQLFQFAGILRILARDGQRRDGMYGRPCSTTRGS